MLAKFDTAINDARRRLTAGDYEGTARLLETARSIDPSSPTLAELGGRLSDAIRARETSRSAGRPTGQEPSRPAPSASVPPPSRPATPPPVVTTPSTPPQGAMPSPPIPDPAAAIPVRPAEPAPQPQPRVEPAPPPPRETPSTAAPPAPPAAAPDADDAAIRAVIAAWPRHRRERPQAVSHDQAEFDGAGRAPAAGRISRRVVAARQPVGDFARPQGRSGVRGCAPARRHRSGRAAGDERHTAGADAVAVGHYLGHQRNSITRKSMARLIALVTVCVFTAVPVAHAQQDPFNLTAPVRSLATMFTDLFGPRGLVVDSLATLPGEQSHSAHFNSDFQFNFTQFGTALVGQLVSVLPSPAGGFTFEFDSSLGVFRRTTGCCRGSRRYDWRATRFVRICASAVHLRFGRRSRPRHHTGGLHPRQCIPSWRPRRRRDHNQLDRRRCQSIDDVLDAGRD